jgi:hypothetical protein
MRPRRLRLLSGLVLAAVLLPAGPLGGQEKPKLNPKEQAACARACVICALECAACERHCLTLVAGGDKKHLTPLVLCQDCADLCGLTAKVVVRRGPSWALMADACAKLCKACAEQCGKFDHEQMKRCAKACEDCEKACRAVLPAPKKKAS